MQVAKDTVVALNYELFDVDGNLIEKTDAPIEYLHGGYDGIYSNGLVIEVACWAHARRKFFDARETDGARSAQMLAMVAQLYAVEEQASRRIAASASDRPVSAEPRKNTPSASRILIPISM